MSIIVRPLAPADVPAAIAINRAAFGRFFGIPDPAKFRVGADMIEPRRRLWPEGALALDLDGTLAATALMMRWGSVGLIGPVTVAPEHWSKGLARLLMAKLMEIAERGGFAFTGLVTHPQSPKHVRLYESFGFRMQRITAVMAKAPAADPPAAPTLFSRLPASAQARALVALRVLTDAVHPGLDVAAEIADLAAHDLGDTVLLADDDRFAGMAICHAGRGSEASEGQVLVKFAAARGGDGAPERFRRLLAACEGFAASRGAGQVVAGTNTGRAAAYELMREAGYRTVMNCIAMTRPSTDGYNRPDVFAIDDWR
jgi:GNAT superfamily N-acetyltransferase